MNSFRVHVYSFVCNVFSMPFVFVCVCVRLAKRVKVKESDRENNCFSKVAL